MSLKKKTLALLAGVTIGLSTMFTGCGSDNFANLFKNEMKQGYNCSQEQADTGLVPAYRNRYLVRDPKTGKFVPKYSVIGLSEMIQDASDMRQDINDLLSTKIRYAKHIKENGIRPHLKLQEKVNEFHIRRLTKIRNYLDFQHMMGYSTDKSIQDLRLRKYSIAMTFPNAEIDEKLKLRCDEIEEIKVRNVLEKQEEFVKYWKRVPNPKFPYADKLEKTIWKEVSGGLVLIGYDIDQPSDHKIDYIEGFRRNEKGELEHFPALKVFRSLSSDKPNVLLLDTDYEGERGFNEADLVGKINQIDSLNQFKSKYGKLINLLFKDKTKYDRIEQVSTERDINIEERIVKVGDLEKKLWVVNSENYKPSRYKNDNGSNFVIEEEFEQLEEGQNISEGQKIKYFKKIYKDPKEINPNNFSKDVRGRVVEFFKLKKEYSDKKVDWHYIEKINNKLFLEIAFNGNNNSQKGRLEDFIEKDPFMIAFDSGKKRVWIKDEDGKPGYETRKVQAKPLTLYEVQNKD